MKKMGYSPDTCPPEVVNKLKAFMKVKKELLEAVEKHPPTPQQCVTHTKEQHASSTSAAQVPPEPETPVIDVPPELQQQFKLLASLSLPLLKAPDPNSRFDEGSVTRGNLLRQLTDYMKSVGEPPAFDSMNSVHQHHLINFPQRKKDGKVGVKRGIDELMSLPNIQTGDIVDQLVTYLLSDHKEAFLLVEVL